DVGGGSTELAIGDPNGQVHSAQSLRIGSGLLTDSCVLSDPPSTEELETMRVRVDGEIGKLSRAPVRSALAVGGTATSMGRLVGPELSRENLQRAIELLAGMRVDEVADRYRVDPVRVRLLPAGILVLQAVSERLERTLRIAPGGLREGVVLELADQAGPAGAPSVD
ncbi:MAG: Ppx/GppA phosphatase family protein, partial [Thermoleophilaceae bacterium]